MTVVEVYNANQQQFLAQKDIQAGALANHKQWGWISLPITVSDANNRL